MLLDEKPFHFQLNSTPASPSWLLATHLFIIFTLNPPPPPPKKKIESAKLLHTTDILDINQ